ncbi:protein CNPPD1 [Drosophila ficusphila]|uniref:protein CNPPD1 n=1 Tax=Drosophila ficusphila TaxID=30025 RepID=UPI0007E733A8|nr:protein CNPPD1 [Drosophila ficusphila]
MGRSKFVAPAKEVMNHNEFINRIRKSLYYGVETSDTEMVVSLPLAEYAAEMFSEPHRGHSLHRLSWVAAAKVQATPCSLIMALIYLDRLNHVDPGFGCRITPQELFVVSLMVSTKFYAGHDERFYLEDWANEGNVSEDRLKEMELQFLSAMDWNIYISNEHFFDKLASVEQTLAERQGLRRGWLTYSELAQLLPSFVWTKFLVNSVTVLAFSYAASVITLAGAFFVASQVPGTLWNSQLYNGREVQPSTMNNKTTVSAPNTTQAITCESGELSASPLNESCAVSSIEPNFQQQYCDEARTNKSECLRRFVKTVPSLSLIGNSSKRDFLFSQDDTRNWLNIKSQYSDYQTNQNYWITLHNTRLESYWMQGRNRSVLWQLIDSMQQSFFL